MKKVFRKNRKGFTLVELIIVIAILAILAAVAIPNFIGLTKEANRGKNIGNATSIVSAINTYNALNPDKPLSAATVSSGADLQTALGNLWPQGMSDDDRDIAVSMIIYDTNTNVATVNTSSTSSPAPTT